MSDPDEMAWRLSITAAASFLHELADALETGGREIIAEASKPKTRIALRSLVHALSAYHFRYVRRARTRRLPLFEIRGGRRKVAP